MVKPFGKAGIPKAAIMIQALPKNILLVRDRDFFFHVFQLAKLFVERGHRVTVLYTHSQDIEPLYLGLIEKAIDIGVRCLLVRDRIKAESRFLARFKALHRRFGVGLKSEVITRNKINGARALLHEETFDCIIAYDPASVFLACKLYPNALQKIVDYSIEVYEEGSPRFRSDETLRSFVYFERNILPRLGALLIQDRYREALLLKHAPRSAREVKVIHFPVSVFGPAIKMPSYGLYDAVVKDRKRKRVLFFGGLWSAILIQRLREVSEMLADDEVLIVHGGRGTVDEKESISDKLIIIRRPINFEKLDELISSADIGLALYPDRDPNCQYTAFSSEKIARYTKSGIPFIAFANEDYEYLRDTAGCCVLIDRYDQIPGAVRYIRKNYDRYRAKAFQAFDAIYDISVASRSLVDYVEGA